MNGTILDKERVDITLASPYFMSEFHKNRQPEQENKLEGPEPKTAIEAQQQASTHPSQQVCKQVCKQYLAGVPGVQQEAEHLRRTCFPFQQWFVLILTHLPYTDPCKTREDRSPPTFWDTAHSSHSHIHPPDAL